MKSFTIFLVGLFSCFAAPNESVAQTPKVVRTTKVITPQMTALPVHMSGRMIVRANPAPYRGKTYTHQWPGVYFETHFNGKSVILQFADPYNEYRLFIDGGAPQAIKQVGDANLTITGLGTGQHRLRLEKVTESISLVGAFKGFYVPSQGNAETTRPRKRQIEFIGDSNMTGYGLRSNKRQCSQDEIRLLSDTQRSYPALVAKNFGADYQVNAVSGRGMVRNYDGFGPGIVMPKIYPFALLDGPQTYRGISWKPQITFIALGENDFATPLKAGEAWETSQQLFKSYVTEYARFLSVLHARNPKTSVIIWWPFLYTHQDQIGAATVAAEKQKLLATARRMGFASVDYIPTTDLGLEATACDYHASASDHLKMKKWLVTYLAARQRLWQGN